MTSAALGPLGLTMLLSYRKRTRRNRALLGFLLALSVAGALAGGMALFNPKSVSAAPLAGAPTTISYDYDSLYRLTESEYSTGEKFTYTYDAAGNRLTQTAPGSQTTYAYDDADRLENLTQLNAAQASKVYAYQWDANGNLLTDGQRSFAYDSANQLTQAISGTVTARYSYSGDGLRLMQDVNGALTRYAQDIASALPQVIFEANPQAQVTYVSAGSLSAAYDAGQWAYQLPDALGSVRQQTDADGLVRMARGYAPFGETLWQAGKPIGSFGYAGEEEDKALDAVAGLVYLRSRYYDPATGRFITRDSYPATAPIPQTLHRYAYVGNDPVNRTDPSGQTWSDAFANVPHEVARRPQPKINRRAKSIAYQSMQKGGLAKDQPYDPYLEPVNYDQYLSRKAYFYEKDIEKKKQDPNYEKQRNTEKAFEVAFRYSNLAAGKPVEENPFANSKPRSFVTMGDKDTGEYETYYVDSENKGHKVLNDPSYYTHEARVEREQKIQAKVKAQEDAIAAENQQLRDEALNKYGDHYSSLTDQEVAYYKEHEVLPVGVDKRDVVDAEGRVTTATVYDYPPVGSQHSVRQIMYRDENGHEMMGYVEVPEGGKLASEQTRVESACNWAKNASAEDWWGSLVQGVGDFVQDPVGSMQSAKQKAGAIIDEVMADPGAALGEVKDLAVDVGKKVVDEAVTEIKEVIKPVTDAIQEASNYVTSKVNEGISEVRNAMKANGLGDVVTFLESPQTRMAFGVGVIVGSAILTGGTSLIYAGVGMALAGAMNYGTQVYNNYQNNSANPWQDVNLYSIGQSMFEGAVAGSFCGATNAFFGQGIVGNALQSIASQPITNYVMGRPVMQDVLDPGVILQGMIFDKVVDVGAQAIGGVISKSLEGGRKAIRAGADAISSAARKTYDLVGQTVRKVTGIAGDVAERVLGGLVAGAQGVGKIFNDVWNSKTIPDSLPMTHVASDVDVPSTPRIPGSDPVNIADATQGGYHSTTSVTPYSHVGDSTSTSTIPGAFDLNNTVSVSTDMPGRMADDSIQANGTIFDQNKVSEPEMAMAHAEDSTPPTQTGRGGGGGSIDGGGRVVGDLASDGIPPERAIVPYKEPSTAIVPYKEPSTAMVPYDPDTAFGPQDPRRLNFTPRLTDTIKENLTPGQHLLIELKELSNGKLGLKKAVSEEGFRPYKTSEFINIKSDADGYVRLPDGTIVGISDPDIMAGVKDGRLMTQAETDAWRESMNKTWQKLGPHMEGDGPFPHSGRATYYTKPGAKLDIALDIPTHVVDFHLDAEGNLRFDVVSGKSNYLNHLQELTPNENLSSYPWWPRETDFVVSPRGEAVPGWVADMWDQGNSEDPIKSIAYHYNKHGNGRSLEEYTLDALNFYQANKSQALWGQWKSHWQPSYKLATGNQHGYYSSDGKILTYWDN
jgi:RHS repeat-associated protein